MAASGASVTDDTIDATLNEDDYSEPQIIRKRTSGKVVTASAETSGPSLTAPAEPSPNPVTTAAAQVPVAPPAKKAQETPQISNSAAPQATAKPEPAKPTGPSHQIILPDATGRIRPRLQIGIVQSPQNPSSAQNDGLYFLEPIPHTQLREKFEPGEGTHILALIHPFTGQAFGVQVTLPAGMPRIKIDSDEIEFDYGTHEVEVSFNRDGSISMDYDN